MLILAGNIYLLVKSSAGSEGDKPSLPALADFILTNGFFGYITALVRWPLGSLTILSGIVIFFLGMWLLPN